jgi:hypothetical protein
LGYLLAYYGNDLQGLELVYSALEMAQQHHNKQALGIIYNDLSIAVKDSVKTKEYLFKALSLSEAAGDDFNTGFLLCNIAKQYSIPQKRDSALYYAQRSYELCLNKNLESALPYSLQILAQIHYSLYNDKGIAYEYIKKAMRTKAGMENTDYFVANNTTLANFFLTDGKSDSAIYYTNNAFNRLNMGANLSYALGVYDLYKEIYLNTNKDSALKYYKLYETTKDSADKLSNIQQRQLLTIKKELELDQLERSHKQNLQFALIALGIITFIIIFLLLSRSIVANERFISFFGVLGLLIVFEFINLLIHPWLAHFTHESPVLMLVALVLLASLLIPLHHRLEKWIKEKMIEKNKKIRLAAAKKTIEKLDTKTENL